MTDRVTKVTLFLSPDYDHRDPEKLADFLGWTLRNRFDAGIPLEMEAETIKVDDFESSKYNKKSTDVEEYEELFQDTGEKGGETL